MPTLSPMARSIWKGALSFGLVSVPVKLYGATTSKTVRFHQLHSADHGRIKQQRVCSLDGEEVPYEDIVKGYEIAPERYVVVEDAELATLAPEATHTIEIEDFVDVSEIDPIYFDQPYYVVPDRGGERPYGLLLTAMRDSGRVAIAHVVLRSRERLVAVHPHEEVLLMTTMNYADEVNPTSELNELDGERPQASKRELDVAKSLIDSLSQSFEIERYRDTYRDAVLELVERKARGEEVVAEPQAAQQATKAPDLMSALQASLERARERGGTAARGNGAKPRRKAGAGGAKTPGKASTRKASTKSSSKSSDKTSARTPARSKSR
jgi:DNA end-binding protein Ku